MVQKKLTNYYIFGKIYDFEKLKILQKHKKFFVKTRKRLVCCAVVLFRNTPKYFSIIDSPYIPPHQRPSQGTFVPK